jgi:hypothetical protein
LGPGKSEICDLDGAALVDQQILRLQISMQNPPLVAKQHSLDDLAPKII